MRTLHVAALPFPSPQGTQGLLHQMLRALGEHGHDSHLLCYPHGAPASGPDAQQDAQKAQPRYTVHRVPARSFTRSLRSGPSFDKLWLDVALVRELRRLAVRLSPALIVAHHVEAAACSLALGDLPTLFVAHTSLREELPTYAPRVPSAVLRRAGGALDTWLVRRSARTCAVSPTLARLLSVQAGRQVDPLPLPWPLAAPLAPQESLAARAALGLLPEHEVVLYAGNLDAYQGLPALLPGLALLARRRPALRWLIATESPLVEIERALARVGLGDRALFAPLADEGARRLAHAAADCALIPRQSAGGVPVKLLDAMARGIPVVAAHTALAGYAVEDCCTVVREQTPQAWCAAIAAVLDDCPRALARASLAHAYVAREHTPERFVEALERWGPQRTKSPSGGHPH